MSTIIAGRFSDIDRVNAALAALPTEGFAREEYAGYYVAPPGEHGLLPLGGDAHSDEGAREAGSGAAVGAVTGGAAGTVVGGAAGAAAGAPIGGPVGAVVGAGIGAYVGSLVGALRKTRPGRREHADTEEPVERAGGAMIAVCVDRPGAENKAIALLERHDADEIERAHGDWRDGGWQDFDPRVPTETVRKKDS
jgi:hypothetical protein